jgi:hypothetical protein
MAIRVNKNKLKLSTLQVQEARSRYYNKCEPASQLAYDYNVSESLMKDAIYGKRGYANIPDDIPPETKDPKNRAEFKSKFVSDYRSYQRRNEYQYKKWETEYLKQGYKLPGTPLHMRPSPANIDWKDEERKERVAQNRHWKGWD